MLEDKWGFFLILTGILVVIHIVTKGIPVRIGHGLGVYEFIEIFKNVNIQDIDYIWQNEDSLKNFLECATPDFPRTVSGNLKSLAEYQNFCKIRLHNINFWYQNKIKLNVINEFDWKRICLEVCPCSNMVLANNLIGVATISKVGCQKRCPINDMVEGEYKICLGSDDPAIHSGLTMNMAVFDSREMLSPHDEFIIEREESVYKWLFPENGKQNIALFRESSMKVKFVVLEGATSANTD